MQVEIVAIMRIGKVSRTKAKFGRILKFNWSKKRCQLRELGEAIKEIGNKPKEKREVKE